MARIIGLDLGTTYTRICTPEQGVILRSPTAAAIDSRTHEVMALGHDARKMMGKTPESILAYRPIKDGVVSDFEVTALMLDAYFMKYRLRSTFHRPTVLLAMPYRITEAEKLAAENAVLEAGARDVPQVPAVFAAAVGAGLRVWSPRGCMVLNVGGGITEAAVISAGGIVNARSVRMAGERLDVAIMNYLVTHRRLQIGDSTAETLKNKIGTADRSIRRGQMTVYGLNTGTGLAASMNVTSEEVSEAIAPSVDAIARIALLTLEGVQPEISSDIHSLGIMLTGGCAMIPGLARAISRSTGLRVTVAKDPLDCVITGLGRIIAKPSLWSGELDLSGRLSGRLF